MGWLCVRVCSCGAGRRCRLTLAVAGDSLEDAVFDVPTADSMVSRLAAELDWMQVSMRRHFDTVTVMRDKRHGVVQHGALGGSGCGRGTYWR